MRKLFFELVQVALGVRPCLSHSPSAQEWDELYAMANYADVYTYSHVLSRHYVPLMNKGFGGTLNEPIPYVDVFELPKSLLELINDYANHGIITKSTEYLLFEMDGMKYILWIKYGVIPNLKDKMGFEIRSFYRCSEQRDINKYEGLTRRHIREGLYAVV